MDGEPSRESSKVFWGSGVGVGYGPSASNVQHGGDKVLMELTHRSRAKQRKLMDDDGS